MDGDKETAWNSNGSEVGNGPGITLTFSFTKPQHIGEIRLRNGYQESDEVYKENGRIKLLDVTSDDRTATWNLKDEQPPQTLQEDLVSLTSQIALTVRKVYPGKRYLDLAVSEITFLAWER